MHTGINWPILQLIIDCILIGLILFLLFVLFREHKQRLILKKWILRQIRIFTEQDLPNLQKEESAPLSVEDAIERLKREISRAQALLASLEEVSTPVASDESSPEASSQETPETPPPEPTREEPDAVTEAIRYLLKKGMHPLEISKQLHIPIDEVERAYGKGLTSRKGILD
ncbi:MAG: hypothetical protein DSY91_07310 [Deltaproteobacteria bacterium]|nr:MAG: hypothetical protein DSY91_07310 [Deltaproteobacteria bacterium]